ncbi:MAG: hypothetical protein ACFFDW_08135 [Candidatus Thorarchaeota archaeon]
MFAINCDKGKEYLKKVGTDVFIIFNGNKFVFQPGSAYEDINKEKLPEKFFIASLNKEISLSREFVKQYKVTHRVDFDRLIRGCSILLTNFTGPESNDNIKNHLQRLFTHFMLRSGVLCEEDIKSALSIFGDLIKIPKKNKITIQDFQEVAQVLGDYYKLWDYSAMDFF